MIKVIEFPDDANAEAVKATLTRWLNERCFSSASDRLTPPFVADDLFYRHTTRPVWWTSVTGLRAAVPAACLTEMVEQVGVPGAPGPLLRSVNASYVEVPDLVTAGYLEPYPLLSSGP